MSVQYFLMMSVLSQLYQSFVNKLHNDFLHYSHHIYNTGGPQVTHMIMQTLLVLDPGPACQTYLRRKKLQTLFGPQRTCLQDQRQTAIACQGVSTFRYEHEV